MTNSDQDNPPTAAAEVDRRRTGAQGSAALEAERVAQLEAKKAALAAHDARVREHERAITGAKQVLASHKAALKGSDRTREALLSDIRKARKASAKAARKARQADAAYDRAVLARLVDQEKAADQRAHPRPGTATAPATPAEAAPRAKARSGSTLNRPAAAPRRPKVNREETSTGERVTIDQG